MKKGIDYVGVAVAGFVHDGKGNYLFDLRTENCRDEQNCWEFAGGGGLEVGETIEAGLRREILEELGVEALSIEFIGNREVFRDNTGVLTHWLTFDHLVQVNPDDVKIMEPDMCAELRWCSLDNLPTPPYSQMMNVVEKYKDKL